MDLVVVHLSCVSVKYLLIRDTSLQRVPLILRQSRHPPLFPAPLVVSQFPPPPPVPSTSGSPVVLEPTLSAILALLLPLTHTLTLSLESLNKLRYTPESKDEDLHAGVLQLPQGTVLLVSEGGVREGQLLERGAFV